MKVAIVLACVLAVSSAGLVAGPAALVRTPSLDSAVIQSDRLGGNFAYSAIEGHAYAAVSPVVQNVVHPVGVSYTAHQVPLGHAVLPVTQLVHAPGVVAAPGFVAAPGVVSAPGLFVAGAPAAAPAAPASDAAPAPAAPAPSNDAAVSSDDTVSVEAA